MKWFRLYDDVLDNEKMTQLTTTQFGVWVKLLAYVNRFRRPNGGQDATILKTSEGHLAAICHSKRFRMVSHLSRFEEIGLVTITDKEIIINGWNNRQFVTDDSTKRAQKHRENATLRATSMQRAQRQIQSTESEDREEKNPPTPPGGTKDRTPDSEFLSFVDSIIDDYLQIIEGTGLRGLKNRVPIYEYFQKMLIPKYDTFGKSRDELKEIVMDSIQIKARSKWYNEKKYGLINILRNLGTAGGEEIEGREENWKVEARKIFGEHPIPDYPPPLGRAIDWRENDEIVNDRDLLVKNGWNYLSTLDYPKAILNKALEIGYLHQ